MNPVFDFSADDHATMLGDQIRLEAFHRAISNQVKPGMVVAEVGTGTGILSAYAASKTDAQVFAIEFYEKTAKIAGAMMKAAGLNQVKILNGESYGITLDPQPEILITETIGALGPEENIVEICHDFKKRHPKLVKFIPSKLRVYAEPIRSKRISNMEQEFYDYFSSASFGTFKYESIRDVLSQSWTSIVRYGSIYDAETMGSRTELANYILGETSISAFSQVVDLSQMPDAEAVHLYFETDLDESVLLSTHYSDPETHWRNAFVSRPKGMNRLTVSYSAASERLQAEWGK